MLYSSGLMLRTDMSSNEFYEEHYYLCGTYENNTFLKYHASS